jgi:hypothetical protein
MKRVLLLLAVLCLGITVSLYSAEKQLLLIDDFEGEISGVPDGTVDYGAGNGSSIEVSAATDVVHGGKQALKVTFDAVSGGYMWVARGFDLNAKGTGWLLDYKDINWNKYNALAFYMYGSDSKTRIAFDLKDNGNEMWRYIIEDNFKGWKKIICPFNEFFARSDWQPDNADKNVTLDFPLKSYQFEPLPEAKGTLYFDDVELVKQ